MKVASGNVLWQQRKRNWCRTPFTFTVYTLTDKELSVKTGVLNEKFNLVKLFRIVDISVERTFLQRLFGMSTLVLDTRDQSSGNGVVVLKNIVHGFEVRQMLQDAVDASRSENGMTAREFIGGLPALAWKDRGLTAASMISMRKTTQEFSEGVIEQDSRKVSSSVLPINVMYKIVICQIVI